MSCFTSCCGRRGETQYQQIDPSNDIEIGSTESPRTNQLPQSCCQRLLNRKTAIYVLGSVAITAGGIIGIIYGNKLITLIDKILYYLDYIPYINPKLETPFRLLIILIIAASTAASVAALFFLVAFMAHCCKACCGR